MKRKGSGKWSSLLQLIGIVSTKPKANDRAYWIALMDKIATPVLSNMSKGMLRKNMPIEYGPAWDGRTTEAAYMEAFGRLIAGLAPFLALPDDNSAEGKIRQRLRLQTLQSLAHAVDPNSPDYLYWGSSPDYLYWDSRETRQPLVDAAYIAQAFLAAPDILWQPLDFTTQQHFVKEFKSLRQIEPYNSNW